MKRRIFSLLMVLALAAVMLIPAAVAEEAAVSVDPFEEILAEFDQAKNVDEPYEVVTKPTRVSGFVFLRWAPSKSAPPMANYPAKQELTVLKETPNWLLVVNKETNDVGYLNKAFAGEPGAKSEEKVMNPKVVDNGKTDLGVIDINGAFSLQCKMADGYDIRLTKSTSDQLIAIVSAPDPNKPVLQLSVAYDEAYANVERMNDLDDEAMAKLEKTFTDVDPTVEITYGDTGLGTRLMIVRETDNGVDYLDFLSVYKGYFVECVMVMPLAAADRELKQEQIDMCIDFLTQLDFVSAADSKAPEGRWMANLTDYNAEEGTVKAELKHGITLDAAVVENLKTGDTLTVGQYSEVIDEIEKDEDGSLIINHGDMLVNYGGEYHLLLSDYEYLEPFANLTLTIPDSLVFEDGIDPATGEPLEEPVKHTAEEFKAMLAEEETPGFALDNVYATFDAEGNWLRVEREYAPWQ